MRFYIGSKIENIPQVRELRDHLFALGWECTYDWTAHGSVRGDGAALERLQQVARDEAAGVTSADVVIILLPGGRGTHTELGLAIGAGQGETVFVWAPNASLFAPTEATSVFYHHESVRQIVGVSMRRLVETVLFAVEDEVRGWGE